MDKCCWEQNATAKFKVKQAKRETSIFVLRQLMIEKAKITEKLMVVRSKIIFSTLVLPRH